MVKIDKKTGEKVFTLDIPQYDANQMYLRSIFDILNSLTEVAKVMESYDDIRYSTLTEMLINLCLDQDIQDRLINEREDQINNIDEDVSDSERNRQIHSINIKTIGQWIKTINKYMSLEEKLEVMRVGPND